MKAGQGLCMSARTIVNHIDDGLYQLAWLAEEGLVIVSSGKSGSGMLVTMTTD
jgi:hypothetical protein